MSCDRERIRSPAVPVRNQLYVDRRTVLEGNLMLGLIISLLIVGLIAGALARLVVPGRQDLSIVGTIVLGVVGSFVGGFLGYLLFGHDISDGAVQTSGIVGSIVGAIIVLLLYRAVNRRHMAHR
jgi:uncharacterized membrane protein YeaQ/YmgE (transglycosylase-associated protein family)